MSKKSDTTSQLIDAAQAMVRALAPLRFSAPVHTVYNPLEYAWRPHEAFLRRYATGPKRIVFVGMNPGPFGMAQTGVPFGEVAAVRDWIGVCEPVDKPPDEHPKRPVEGFACQRSEVSGKRLWGLFAERFGAADAFFRDHFVLNFCPLVFMSETGANLTPDKIAAAEIAPANEACEAHLRRSFEILQPEWIVGVGAFAEGRARAAADGLPAKIGKVLHPSPASPAANRGWAEAATKQLAAQGIW